MSDGRHARWSRAATLLLLVLVQHACVWWTATEGRTFVRGKMFQRIGKRMDDEVTPVMFVRARGEDTTLYMMNAERQLCVTPLGKVRGEKCDGYANARCVVVSPTDGALWFVESQRYVPSYMGPSDNKSSTATLADPSMEFGFCADYGDRAYFFEKTRNKLYSISFEELAKNPRSLNITHEEMDLPPTENFDIWFQLQNGAVNVNYTVDLACVHDTPEGGDPKRCVQMWDSSDNIWATSFQGDFLYSWDDTKPKAYLMTSENKVSPHMFLDEEYQACVVDPLRAHLFCADKKGNVTRLRADDFSVRDTVKEAWSEQVVDPRQMSMVYRDENATICMYSNSTNNGVLCTTFVVSNCSASGAECFEDPAYCRFDLDHLACRSVQSCTDAAVCINSRMDATLTSGATTDVSSTETIAISVDASHALAPTGSGSVQCQFAPGVVSDATVTAANRAECALAPAMAAGEYGVVLVAKEQGLVLTNPVSLVLYDCSHFTDCAACVADGKQCSWVYAETACVHGPANGTGITQRAACPVLAAPSPAVIPQLGVASTVVVPAANVRPGHLSCVFTCDEEAGAGAANVTAAAACEGAFCRCAYDTAAGFGPDLCHLTLRLYYADRAGAPHNPIATAAGTLEARKCAALTSCPDCHVVPQCRWVVDAAGASGFEAGCVAADSAAATAPGATVVEQCPAVTAHTTHVDMLSASPQVTATLAGTAHPETVHCMYGETVDSSSSSSIVATRTVGADSVTYACAVPRSVAGSTTETLALAVPSRAEAGAFVTYAAVGAVHLLYCAQHRQCTPCAAEHAECGFVFRADGSRGACTWAGNASAGRDGTWSRTCFRSTALAPRTLNAAGGTVRLGTGACLAFLDGRYNCTLAHAADGYVYQSVPLRCHNATAAACTFGPSADADGAVPWSTTVTISIIKAGSEQSQMLREDNEEEEDPFAEFAGLTWTATMLNCLSTTSDCATCTGADLAARTRGGCRWSLAQARCVVGSALAEEEEEEDSEEGTKGSTARTLVAATEAECPTLRTVPKEVSPRTRSFRVYGTNFHAAVPVALVLVGAESNATCDAEVLAPTELRVSACRGLPAAPQTLGAVLVVAASGNAYAAGSPTLALVRARFPLWAIVVVAAAVLVLLAAAVAAAAAYARKHGGLRPYRFDVRRAPDFGAFRWATDLWPAGRARAQRSDAQWAQLRALLEDGRVRGAVCRATAATEADRLASALVYAGAADGRAADAVLALVHDEVQGVPGETQLFRGNSLASKAFRAYSRMVGLEYLWLTLARFVHELHHLAEVQDTAARDERRRQGKNGAAVELEESSGMHDPSTGATTTTTTTTTGGGVSILSTEFEVDPTKLGAGADEETQTYMLAQRARQLVLCITQSTPNMPAELRAVAHRLAQEVHARFPGCERIAIGGTFFLRFICPALLAPHCYALLMTPDRRRPVVPGARLQRQLVLLGKVLQNLANGVLFGKKEPFMVRMNQFITRNLDTVGRWMDEISSDAAPCHEAPADVPHATLADTHQFLLAHISANLAKIQANLQQAAAPPELAASLQALVQA